MEKPMKGKTLTEELLVEILLKLPVNSLLRFRSVCKSWCNLIKSPNFIKMHLNKNHGNILVIRCPRGTTTCLLSFHSYQGFNLISSPQFDVSYLNHVTLLVCEPCNGLLCFLHQDDVVLCNPSLKEFKVLPPRPFPCPKRRVICTVGLGLGFDSITNDYKVVRIVLLCDFFGDDNFYIFEIYNLSTNTWREIDQRPNLKYMEYTSGFGTLFNGAFHWIVSGEDSINSLYILSFDMSTEVFRSFELPHFDPNEQKCNRLIVLDESLALFAYTDPRDFPEQEFVDVWVMQRYGVAGTWTRKFKVGPLTGLWCPFLLWKNDAFLMENTEGRLVSCALDTLEITDFNIHGVEDTLRVMAYQESLVSIK